MFCLRCCLSALLYKNIFLGGFLILSGLRLDSTYTTSWYILPMQALLIDETVPTKLINNTKKKLAWITREIKTLLRKRNKLLKRMKLHNSTKLVEAYKNIKQIIINFRKYIAKCHSLLNVVSHATSFIYFRYFYLDS
jgi:hypothetical protein